MFKLLFVILALFLIMYAVNQKCSNSETFDNTTIPITSDNVADHIYKIYKADVKAIQNLADIAMKLQAGGITVPGTMTIKNTLNVEGIAEITGATNLKSTLNVEGDITGKTIKELRDKIAVLEAKTVKLGNDGNIIDHINCNGMIIFPRADIGIHWPQMNGYLWQRFGELWLESNINCVIHGHSRRDPTYL
jgi:hypothetical protein